MTGRLHHPIQRQALNNDELSHHNLLWFVNDFDQTPGQNSSVEWLP
jgi:hypothetical protein